MKIRGQRTQKISRDWRSSTLRQRSEAAIAPQKSAKTALDSDSSRHLLSSRQLDLMLLAVCSCVLTFLCHPAINLPQSSAGASPAMETSLPSTPSQINFYVKSALMSTFQRGKSKDVEKVG